MCAKGRCNIGAGIAAGLEETGEEAYDASIGGQKGLLYVGRSGGEAEVDGGDGDSEGGGAVRFVSARDGATLLSLDASRVLSCSAKGRYRMLLSYDDADDGEKRLCLIRVYGMAVDRVIGVVLELADAAKAAADVEGSDDKDGQDRRVPAVVQGGNDAASYRFGDAGADEGASAGASAPAPAAAAAASDIPDGPAAGGEANALSNTAPE